MYGIMSIHISIPFVIDSIHRFLDGNRTTFGEAADKCIGQVIEWPGQTDESRLGGVIMLHAYNADILPEEGLVRLRRLPYRGESSIDGCDRSF